MNAKKGLMIKPGAWKRRGGSSSQIISFHDDGSERGVIAQVCTDGGTFTKDEAVAHQNLVAAAPDLMSALKKLTLHRSVPCRFTITKKSDDCYTCGKRDRLCEQCADVVEARAAIAKAEAL